MESSVKLNRLSSIFNRHNIIKFSLRALLVLLPFLCVFYISLCFGYKGSFEVLVPNWNDEGGWYKQVEAILQYGHPLGYWGYNESFAQIGTFGPWGIAPLLPYALFGKIFGWQLNTMAIANISFLSISLLLFVLMTKPSNKQVILLIIAYLSLYIAISYSLTSMSEGLRYSCAIILTGFIIWVERCTRSDSPAITVKQKVLLIVGCIWTLYCVQVYMIFCLVVFILSLFILRKTKLKLVLRVAASALVTLVTAVITQKLVAMVTCAYFMPSTIETILDQIKTNGLLNGLSFAINNFINNLHTVSFSNLAGYARTNNILFWYFIAYLILMIWLMFDCYVLICSSKDKERTKSESTEGIFSYMALYFLAGYLVGYCFLYTGSDWTLCRGTNTGLIMAVFLLIFENKHRYTFGHSLMTAVAIVSVWSWLGGVINDRASILQYKEQIYAEKEQLSEIMKISSEFDEWDNTVAIYGEWGFWALSLPTGIGENGIFNGEAPEKSKYAAMPVGMASEEMQLMLANGGYELIYSDEIVAVFEKTSL